MHVVPERWAPVVWVAPCCLVKKHDRAERRQALCMCSLGVGRPWSGLRHGAVAQGPRREGGCGPRQACQRLVLGSSLRTRAQYKR